MNKDIAEQVAKLAHQMTEHEIDELRWNILNFANSCRNGRKHSKDEFEHVISDHSKPHSQGQLLYVHNLLQLPRIQSSQSLLL